MVGPVFQIARVAGLRASLEAFVELVETSVLSCWNQRNAAALPRESPCAFCSKKR